MKGYLLPRIAPRAIGLGLLLAASSAGLAFADAPVPNKGDTAWMLTSSALVLMMSIPGLALFYAGMARPKNAASMAAQVFAIVAMVGVIWCLYGYSLAFTEGSHTLVPFASGDHPWLGFLQGYEWNNLVGGFDRRNLFQRRRHSRICLYGLSDDLRHDYPGLDCRLHR